MNGSSINRRDFVKMAGSAVASFVAMSNFRTNRNLLAGTKEEDLPNVLFVLTDDVGYGDILANNPDSKVTLPNIEKLAKRGMVFSDAHSPSAVCAPTRYSVLTGNYPCRGRDPFGSWAYNQKCQILEGQKTLGNLFEQKGYHTAMIGKMHLGGHFYSKTKKDEYVFFKTKFDYKEIDFSRRFRMGPLDYGFNYSFLLPGGNFAPPYAYLENDKLVGDPNELVFWKKGKHGDSVVHFDGVGMPDWDSREVGPILANKAIEFIDRYHKDNLKKENQKPFFIYYCATAIHTPLTPPDKLGNVKIKGQSINSYTDMLLEIDAALGRMMTELEKRDLLQNTMIVFTSDNGAWPNQELMKNGHNSNAPLRGYKGQIWEGGHRVPLIVSWGDGTSEGSKIQPNSRCDQLLGLQDFYATFSELMHQKVENGQAIDSVSILPRLLNKSSESVRKYLVVQSNKHADGNEPEGPGGGKFWRAIRENEWKLIVNDKEEPLELYNLKGDLQETHNLVHETEQQIRIQRMLDKYKEIMKNEATELIETEM